MLDQFSRTTLLLGKEGLAQLKNTHVVIFGIGGVGSFVVESLVRSGVGKITMVDHDNIAITNLNRQIMATHKTVGLLKVDAMKARVCEINPDLEVHTVAQFISRENIRQLAWANYTYVVDAIDTVTSKLLLVEEANRLGIPIISSMGTGNKLDPARLEVDDIYKTTICPLAKVMRKELRKRGIPHLKVVYSKEEPIVPRNDEEDNVEFVKKGNRMAPGSVSFVPSVAGLIISSVVIKDILDKNLPAEH